MPTKKLGQTDEGQTEVDYKALYEKEVELRQSAETRLAKVTAQLQRLFSRCCL